MHNTFLGMAKSKKIFYTMGQVSEMFDLAPSTIRFWEKRFAILHPRKNAKGNRLFAVEDVENLKMIYHLTKEKRMTLDGAEKFMMQRRLAAKGEMSVVEVLQKIRSTLVEIRQEIESVERPSENQIIVHSEQVELLADTEEPQAATMEAQEVESEVQEVAEELKPRYIELTLF